MVAYAERPEIVRVLLDMVRLSRVFYVLLKGAIAQIAQALQGLGNHGDVANKT